MAGGLNRVRQIELDLAVNNPYGELVVGLDEAMTPERNGIAESWIVNARRQTVALGQVGFGRCAACPSRPTTLIMTMVCTGTASVCRRSITRLTSLTLCTVQVRETLGKNVYVRITLEDELEVMTATLTHDDPGATFGEVTAFLDQFTPITEHTVYVKTSLQTKIVHLRALIQ